MDKLNIHHLLSTTTTTPTVTANATATATTTTTTVTIKRLGTLQNCTVDC